MKANHDQAPSCPKRASEHFGMVFARCGMMLIGLRAAISILSALCCFAAAAQPSGCRVEKPSAPSSPIESACLDSSAKPQIREALEHICRKDRTHGNERELQRTLVIGFLGGFVRRGDKNHPEVWFADYLQEHYASAVYGEVFSNHDGKVALRQVLRLLDTNCDGVLTASEREHARIILFGHSWGASETIAFAHALEKLDIPVLLTIQIDIVSKPFQDPYSIPANVKEAVNFFQSRGLLHGRAGIVAIDPARTRILGDFPMAYTRRSVDCGNFPWFARTFNKPHHSIENDPRVWDRVAALIDAQIRLHDEPVDQAALASAER